VTTTIQRWQLEYDSDATRRCFVQLPVGSGCDCQECRNFFAAIDHAFPPEFTRIADKLGIDTSKPSELAHFGRDGHGPLIVGGWFHFVGSILAGADAMRYDAQGTGQFHLEHLTPTFQLGFTPQLALVPQPFDAHAVVQLEFHTRMPWLLAEEYAPEITSYPIKT
jgi:hypothetical protein